MQASTLRNRHGSARLDAQNGYAGTPTIGNARSLWFPFHSWEASQCGVERRPPVQGRSELQAHEATVLQCLAAEEREGLGRSPGPCHTSSASFLSTPHRFAKVAERMPGQLSGDLLDHELSSVERDRVTGALALQLDSDEPRRVVRESRQQQCRDAGHHRKHSATGLLLPSFSKNGATIKTIATG